MSFKKLFLPVGLIVAIIAALAFEISDGAAASLKPVRPWLVIVIFLINGYQTRLRDAPRDSKFLAAFAITAVTSLILGPWLGLGVGKMIGLSAATATGLLVMSAVPSTLSSGIVLTEIAGGNGLWALILTVGLNLLGVFTIPFMLAWCASGAGVEVDRQTLLMKLLLWVLVPFAVGYFSKRVIGDRQLAKPLKYIPSVCVILTVWISCAASRDKLLSLTGTSLAVIAIGALAVHLTLMAASVGTGAGLRLGTPERRALMFLGSQKTLPVAIGVLTGLGGEVGAAVIVCIVFHFLQLVTDSLIASRLPVLTNVAE